MSENVNFAQVITKSRLLLAPITPTFTIGNVAFQSVMTGNVAYLSAWTNTKNVFEDPTYHLSCNDVMSRNC